MDKYISDFKTTRITEICCSVPCKMSLSLKPKMMKTSFVNVAFAIRLDKIIFLFHKLCNGDRLSRKYLIIFLFIKYVFFNARNKNTNNSLLNMHGMYN